MAVFNIAGRSYSGNSVSIKSVVMVDGVVCDTVSGDVQVIVTEGTIGELTTDRSVKCLNVEGNITASGSIECRDVTGDIRVGGIVECRNVGGNVDAGGSVECGNVVGSVRAGGSISRG
jgi:hypothetical protein